MRIGLALLLNIALLACGDPRIDASSEEAYVTSLSEMRDALGPDERRLLDDSVDRVTRDVAGPAGTQRARLHGKTASQIQHDARLLDLEGEVDRRSQSISALQAELAEAERITKAVRYVFVREVMRGDALAPGVMQFHATVVNESPLFVTAVELDWTGVSASLSPLVCRRAIAKGDVGLCSLSLPESQWRHSSAVERHLTTRPIQVTAVHTDTGERYDPSHMNVELIKSQLEAERQSLERAKTTLNELAARPQR